MLADLNSGGDDRSVCHTVLYHCKIYIVYNLVAFLKFYFLQEV